MTHGTGATTVNVRLADIRRCSGCSSLDYGDRMRARLHATDWALCCAHCGINDQWTISGLTPAQTKAFEDFYAAHPDARKDPRIGTDDDCPIWRP